MITFTVVGPINAPLKRSHGGWHWSNGNGHQYSNRDFWENTSEVQNIKLSKGVYIFALERQDGFLPIYVGKATKGFAKECFNGSNKGKYLQGLAHHSEGTPVIFFVVHPKKKGQTNTRIIAKIEKQLIALAAYRNGNLVNIQDHPCRYWEIQGVLSGNQGDSLLSEAKLRNTLGLHEKLYSERKSTFSNGINCYRQDKFSREQSIRPKSVLKRGANVSQWRKDVKTFLMKRKYPLAQLARDAKVSRATIYQTIHHCKKPRRATILALKNAVLYRQKGDTENG